MIDRSERRYRADKIAEIRLNKLPPSCRDQIKGKFRKWNLTCRCRMCLIGKQSDIEMQRLKDERRNSQIENLEETNAIHISGTVLHAYRLVHLSNHTN